MDGLQTTWYENGLKKSEINYKKGKYDGLWTDWYGKGQKKSEINYKKGKLISYKYWNEDGSVNKEWNEDGSVKN